MVLSERISEGKLYYRKEVWFDSVKIIKKLLPISKEVIGEIEVKSIEFIGVSTKSTLYYQIVYKELTFLSITNKLFPLKPIPTNSFAYSKNG